MRNPFAQVRPAERRETFAAVALLLAVMGSHALLETARDALFLSNIPATQLPWMYLGIAVLSIVLVRLQMRLGVRDRRRTLQVTLAVASVVTLGFWFLLPLVPTLGSYALYLWSGVLSTLVLVHFWTLLSDVFSVTQAKRIFPVIGAGSVAGAILGSGAAAGLARVLAADRLVLISAVALLVGAGLAGRLTAAAGHVDETRSSSKGWKRAIEDARLLLGNVYARRITGLLMLVAATVTVADFLFKQTIAERVPPEELGATLGTLYLVLNVSSLLVQLLLVGFLTRRLTVIGALAVLPLALVATGIGMILAPGLAAAFALKAADGSLRFSLHKTARELLFVPMASSLRSRLKALMDVLGSKGGRGLASLVILGLAAFEVESWIFAALVIGLGVAAMIAVFRLRQPYLAIFREQLRYGHDRVEDRELDAAAIEAMIEALDSADDGVVLVALDQLDRDGRANLVPALILHHPSEAVVRRSLTLFADHRRERALGLIERLLAHEKPGLRAAALVAHGVLVPAEDDKIAALLEDPDPRVSGAARAVRIACEHDDDVSWLLDEADADARMAFAHAVRSSEAHLDEALEMLALDEDEHVRAASGQAMGRRCDARFLPALIGMLGHERTRKIAGRALRDLGDEGFLALAASLSDVALGQSVRWELPGALSSLDPRRAAPLLLARLPDEPSGMVRYRTIRSLQLIVRDHPDISLDRTLLDTALHAAIRRAYRSIDRRSTLLRGVEVDAARATPGHELLVRIIEDKRDNAIERALRLLNLLHPAEEFDRIRRGLRSHDAGTFASSIELLENVLRSPVREAVVGLVDDLDDDARRAAAGSFREPHDDDYIELLRTLLGSTSLIVRAVAVYHAGELQLVTLRDSIEALADVKQLAPDVAFMRSRIEEAPRAD